MWVAAARSLPAMIRVGFVVSLFGREWLGGINYLNNLLSAIASCADSRITTVLLMPDSERESAQLLASAGDRLNLPRWATPVPYPLRTRWDDVRLQIKGRLLEQYLRWHRIDVLSHSGPLLRAGAGIPSLGMIFDLQHKRHPEFFSAEDRQDRDRYYSRQCAQSSGMIVSSEATLGDMRAFYSTCAGKGHVLRFVANTSLVRPTPHDVLRERYALPNRYFLLPNQFWVHKNHRVVIEALRALRMRDAPVHVICTGYQRDYRDPDHFAKLMDLAKTYNVHECFRPIGVVPYEDLIGLMLGAVSVVNPSLFEGWSTSVEEAKSLGKELLLSDISVHREQQPERGRYFEPGDAEHLAELLLASEEAYDPVQESRNADLARRALPDRLHAYASRYQEIVLRVAGSSRDGSDL